MLARVPKDTARAWKQAKRMRKGADNVRNSLWSSKNHGYGHEKDDRYALFLRFKYDEVPREVYDTTWKLIENLLVMADEVQRRGENIKTLNGLKDDK